MGAVDHFELSRDVKKTFPTGPSVIAPMPFVRRALVTQGRQGWGAMWWWKEEHNSRTTMFVPTLNLASRVV